MATSFPFSRLVSNTATVFLGADRAQAALNAANFTGDNPDPVSRRVDPPTWPSLQKFDNDDSTQSFSPFGGVPNPDYIWDLPTSDGQTTAFAVSTGSFLTLPATTSIFTVSLVAFADNAMEAKIELFERTGGVGSPFAKAFPQPEGLDEFLLIAGKPNNPAVGLTIDSPPFTFQDIRMYSTHFTAPEIGVFKIVVSFKGTNYLIQPQYASTPSSLNNPAGLQFMVDIYSAI
ncbi:hypothetical protein SAMN05878482_1096 [Peribacillus simplex]|uniref:Uncharacterized protein n=1 Tax=Peribacillus simplex TaxID=1478 RepID=A0A9X8RDK2_9BACI|nr:hypothetical protein [Peribacillus simplex]SIS01116.1 hypothetical protein SAMN05878482_1096 [Peribacillus simplex]